MPVPDHLVAPAAAAYHAPADRAPSRRRKGGGMAVSIPELQPSVKAKDAVWRLVTGIHWTEAMYLAVANATNQVVELVDGRPVVPPMPTLSHQILLQQAFKPFDAWAMAHGAQVVISAHPTRLAQDRMREPDIAVYLPASLPQLGEQFSGPPDVVVEILSPSTRGTDLGAKRAEYAAAGVREYWVIDPRSARITVQVLVEGEYEPVSVARGEERATSTALPGFELSHAEVNRPPGSPPG
jgi:Uma2 family endonuclease